MKRVAPRKDSPQTLSLVVELGALLKNKLKISGFPRAVLNILISDVFV